MDHKDVVFVYLCNYATKKSWQATIKEHHLNGDHYFVENESYRILAQKFKIEGISRFVLVDQQGKIVASEAKRPGNNKGALNYELMAEINALLGR